LELDKKEEDPYKVFIGASLGSLAYCWRDIEVRRRFTSFLDRSSSDIMDLKRVSENQVEDTPWVELGLSL
jgi:hypothetical protein